MIACRSIALFIALITISSPALSQTYPFHYYTIEQGLVANGATSLFQDSRGYIWIGTGEGMSVFDGITFRNYSVNNGLALNSVTVISESRRSPGEMLIGTFGGGISRFKDGTFSTLLPDSSFLAKQVHAVEEDYGGALWCATADGLYRMSGGEFHRFADMPDVSALLMTRDSLVWLGSGRSLVAYSSASGSVEKVEEIAIPGHGRVVSMHADREGVMWVSTSDSLLVQIHKRVVVNQRGIPHGFARSIVDDADGKLWLGTENGLLSIEREGVSTSSWIRYTTENGLRTNSVTACLVDFEDNLWVANRDAGVFKLSDRDLFTFPLRGIPESYNNCKAVTDLRGHIWAVTAGGVLEIWKDSGRWRSYTHAIRIDPQGKSTLSVVRDRKGRLWIDTKKNIDCYKIDSTTMGHSSLKLIQTFVPGIQLPAVPRFFFIIDSNDNLWVSMLGKGVYSVNPWQSPNSPRYYTMADGLLSNDIRVIYEDRQNNMWFGSMTEGLACMPADAAAKMRRYTTSITSGEPGLPDELIRGVVQDKDGKIWIATRRSGIGVLQSDPTLRDSITRVSIKDGLIGSAVWALAVDDERNLVWAGTQLGPQSIDITTMTPSTPRRVLTGQPVNSLGVYRNHFLWFVTKDAVTVYEHRNVLLNTAPPPTYVTQFKVNARDVDMRGKLEFNHDQSILLFEYAGISYRETEALRYQYRLAGLDVDWHPRTSQRTVTYASVAPGTYTFEVRAVNADGIMSAVPAKVSFTILPAFWQRWWFIVSLIASIMGSALLAFRQRLEKVRSEQRTQQEFSIRLMESQENERKRLAGELHDSLVQNLLVAKNRSLLGMKKAGDAEGVTRELSEISDALTEAIDEVREIAHNLRPYHLDRLGLSKALRALIERMRESSTVEFRETIDPIDSSLRPEDSIQLFRIVQEATNNILKHSGATLATVSVRQNEQMIDVVVSDNGKGFIAHPAAKDDGRPVTFGLGGIEQRVGMMNGTWSIQSSPGSGTTMNIRIPVKGQPQ